MITNSYKNQESRSRVMTSENTFKSGMKYTDNPLSEGYSHTLINFELANDGMTLKPRAGLTTLVSDVTVINGLPDDFVWVGTHHTAQAYVSSYDETDIRLCKYALMGVVKELDTATFVDLPSVGMDMNKAKITVYYDGSAISSPQSPDVSGCIVDGQGSDHAIYATVWDTPYSVHGVVNASLGGCTRADGAYTSMDNNTYLPCIHTWVDEHNVKQCERFIAIIRMKFNIQRTNVSWSLEKLKPRDVNAVQAVNYGYNMLSDSPYSFLNQSTSTGGIVLDGIVPYDSDGNLLTSARVGAEIYFHLIYRYPEDDFNNGKKYYVQWEVQDLSKDSEVRVIQQVRESPAYTPGDTISIRTTQTTFKQFTLVAKIYYKDVVDSKTYDSEAASIELNDSLYLKPDSVITLAYYYLTNDSSTSTLNVEAVNYDLSTAKGMCTWQQRIVLWGVSGAENTLWVSEINDPSWFPYPNNCELFNDDVVACVTYKTSLLVFTKTALYQLDFKEDGLTYTTTCVQERLNLTQDDAHTIIPIQNMVFFKSGNYYYMIVPVTGSMAGALQLAPITRPIEYLLDNFTSASEDILRCAMELDPGTYLNYSLMDWWCTLEQRTVRVNFKFRIGYHYRNSEDYEGYRDLAFVYDTQTRTWLLEFRESTRIRTVCLVQSATAESVFLQMYTAGKSSVVADLLKRDPTSPSDDYHIDDYLGSRCSPSLQYLDTGYRNMNPDLKKRFRQIQFKLTNTYSKSLRFRNRFRIDNDVRASNFKAITEVIDDPEDENYGSYYITYDPIDPVEVEDMDSKLEYLEEWGIDEDRFPDVNTAKVSINVSGKGHMGRFALWGHNTEMYEITSMVWVYRTMYGR